MSGKVTNPAANGRRSLVTLWKEAGPFGFLLWLFPFSVILDWNEDHPEFTNRTNPIFDDEVVDRLEISLETLSSYRGRLKELGLLDWDVLSDGSVMYSLGAIDRRGEFQQGLFAPLKSEQKDGYPNTREIWLPETVVGRLRDGVKRSTQ